MRQLVEERGLWNECSLYEACYLLGIPASPGWEDYGQLLTDTLLVPSCSLAGVAATVAPISLACAQDLTTSHVAMA